LFSWFYASPLWIYLIPAVLLAGLIATARMLVSDHSTREIYLGLVMGAICQWLAYVFIA
jgi:bacteriorhodopsin